jgi:hypothetical protein
MRLSTERARPGDVHHRAYRYLHRDSGREFVIKQYGSMRSPNVRVFLEETTNPLARESFVDSNDYRSLLAASGAIAQHINNGLHHRSIRSSTCDDRPDRLLENQYWRAQWVCYQASLSGDAGIFRGCYRRSGAPLHEKTKHAILSFLNHPSRTQWLTIRRIILCGSITVWSAWCAYDLTAPRVDDALNPDTQRFPTPDQLREAVVFAVRKNGERIRKKIQGLRRELSGTQRRPDRGCPNLVRTWAIRPMGHIDEAGSCPNNRGNV